MEKDNIESSITVPPLKKFMVKCYISGSKYTITHPQKWNFKAKTAVAIKSTLAKSKCHWHKLSSKFRTLKPKHNCWKWRQNLPISITSKNSHYITEFKFQDKYLLITAKILWIKISIFYFPENQIWRWNL